MHTKIKAYRKALRSSALALSFLLSTGVCRAESPGLATVCPFACDGASAEFVSTTDPHGIGVHSKKGFIKLTNHGKGKCGYVMYNLQLDDDKLCIINDEKGEKAYVNYRGAEAEFAKVKIRFVMQPHPGQNKYLNVDFNAKDLQYKGNGELWIKASKIKPTEGLANVNRVIVYLDEKGTIDIGNVRFYRQDNEAIHPDTVNLKVTNCSVLNAAPWHP